MTHQMKLNRLIEGLSWLAVSRGCRPKRRSWLLKWCAATHPPHTSVSGPETRDERESFVIRSRGKTRGDLPLLAVSSKV